MRKLAIIVFLFLLSIISGLLFFQWKTYSNQVNEQTNGTTVANQRIIVESKPNQFYINQTIDGLSPEQTYQLAIPDNISEWTCTTNENEPCQIEKNELTVEQNHRSFTFSFSIPFKKGSESLLLDDWVIAIKQIPFENTKVEVIESVRREGVWIAGAPLVGSEELDLIDYFVFESKNGTFPIYWQNAPLTSAHHQDAFDLFVKEGLSYSPETSCDFLEKIPNLLYTAVVVTTAHAPVHEKGLIITDTPVQGEELDRQLALQYFLQRLPVKYDDWLHDLLASNLIGQDPITKKGRQIISELSESLSETERRAFFDQIVKDQTINSVEEMDEELSRIKGLTTTFLTQNMENKELVALYFTDSKHVLINSKSIDVDAIIRNKTRFFPFIETMESLGFEVEHISDQILLNKEKMSMRFFTNKNIFILNEEDYGLLEKPLVELNGEIYIEQKWLRTIFDVVINEEENQIRMEMEKTPGEA